jgi:hypothetical protein
MLLKKISGTFDYMACFAITYDTDCNDDDRDYNTIGHAKSPVQWLETRFNSEFFFTKTFMINSNFSVNLFSEVHSRTAISFYDQDYFVKNI